MIRPQPSARARFLVEWSVTLAFALAVLFAYLASPVRTMLDSKYALLTSEVLLRDGSWDVSRYFPQLAAIARNLKAGEKSKSIPYQLQATRGRLIYHYPPGTSLLSVPAVALLNRLGGSAITTRGIYSLRGERAMQSRLAALLTALTATLCLRSARRELPLPHAVAVGLVAAFGTCLWSTASRAMWMHTWSALLLAAAWFELLRWECGERRRPEWLGLLLVAAFWVRPTNAVFAVTTALFVLWRHRGVLWRVVVTGALGLAGYIVWSRMIWGAPVQHYLMQAKRMGRGDFVLGALGLLLEPSRGLLVFSPFLVVAAVLLLWRGGAPDRRAFLLLSLVNLIGFVAFYASFRLWWGLGSVGPRYLTELSPVLAWLLAHAWRRQREAPGGQLARAGVAAAAAVAVAASVLAHATGAFDFSGSAYRRGLSNATVFRRAAAPRRDSSVWESLPQSVVFRALKAELSRSKSPAGGARSGKRKRGGA